MEHLSHPPVAPFTKLERDLLRRELCRHFGEGPVIADGIFLRTWRSGERKGQPKIPPAVQTMLDRGLMEVRIGQRGLRAFFTEAGLTALRQLVLDRRAGPGAVRASAGRAGPDRVGNGKRTAA